MGFRINTNIGALNAHANSVVNARELDKSLSRLSSGLRINSAADDASGMAIADSLRSQAATLGQAINNGNDAIGILQTADKAMDEQLKILDTIKTKATQAAQDGQSLKTRTMLQADINRLMEELDNKGNSLGVKDETAGVTTLKGAMAVMDIAETATTNLDQIRADIGSVQNQLQVTINNITVTQVNVKAAESTIRDVDFAAESANFSKYNILAQSGSYAMSQANAVQQNVLKLLQ
nr:flagellin [Campylobacter jejuni]